METRDKALEKAESAAKGMESRKLKEAARCLREGIGETTTHLLDDYPREHRRRIRTNNMIERPDREIRPHPRRGQLPRWQQRAQAHMRESPLRDLQRMVDATLPRHVRAR